MSVINFTGLDVSETLVSEWEGVGVSNLPTERIWIPLLETDRPFINLVHFIRLDLITRGVEKIICKMEWCLELYCRHFRPLL